MLTSRVKKYVPGVLKRGAKATATRVATARAVTAGTAYARVWDVDAVAPEVSAPPPRSDNPLRDFFEARSEGRGIYKWRHYFDIYDRHLAKFVAQSARLLEVGVYSGGSLEMWRRYLGAGSHIYGVDIEPACREYADENVEIVIGDQADREFWQRFRDETAPLDIVIDDGGHSPEQQIVTLEELLPHLCPGGVYICEDIHGIDNPFLAHAYGLSRALYAIEFHEDRQNRERALSTPVTPFQSDVHSVHWYPYLVVIERRVQPVGEFVAPKHGTVWQPFAR